MWKPRLLTTLWAFRACYRDNFTFLIIIIIIIIIAFSLLHVIQTGSGAHPASYRKATGDSFPGGKAAGA
jgi:hypothetical protein